MQYREDVTGKILLYERKRKGWSQETLGKMVGISGKQISKYESGKLFPPMEILTALCKVFDCEMGYLLGEEGYQDRTKLLTSIHELTGLSPESIAEIQRITGTGRRSPEFGEKSNDYIRTLNNIICSSCFSHLMEEIVNLDRKVSTFKSFENKLIEKYGYDIFHKAFECYFSSIDYEHDPDAPVLTPEVIEAYRDIGGLIDDQQSMEYEIKIAKYSVFDAFSELINRLYAKNKK